MTSSFTSRFNFPVESWRFLPRTDRESARLRSEALFHKNGAVLIAAPSLGEWNLEIQLKINTPLKSGKLSPFSKISERVLEDLITAKPALDAFSHRLTALIHLLYAEWSEQTATESSAFPELVEYVHARLDQNIKIKPLAEALNLSPAQLREKSREEFGQNPAEAISHIRMNRARDWLASGIPIETVAEKTGYSDRFAFSRAYKSVTGETPARFQSDNALTN